ncbi:hypothetical protein PS664_02188 [Pseudomonas fluorescens]|nr:hypothetical protein PS664_02188 [Pseudomonas fluorescens]
MEVVVNLREAIAFTILSLFLAANAVAAPALGGKTVDQVFDNPKVVKLIDAATQGRAPEVERLVREGGDPNAVGTDGTTPLIWAINSHNLVGIEALLKAGADAGKTTPQLGKYSPMALASGGDNPNVLKVLLKYGADAKGHTVSDIKEKPLYLASSQGRLENVKLLVNAGADVNEHGERGLSAGEVASVMEHYEVLAWLLENGYSYDLQRVVRNSMARTSYPDPQIQMWRDKVIALIKAKGVSVPEKKNGAGVN